MSIYNLYFLNPIYFILFILILFFIFYFIYKSFKDKNFINLKESLSKIYKLNILKYISKVFLISSILIIYILILANPNILDQEKIIKKD